MFNAKGEVLVKEEWLGTTNYALLLENEPMKWFYMYINV